MTKLDIAITETPELRYTKSALEICTLREDDQHCVAFGDVAMDLVGDVMVGDVIEVTGYTKPYTWTDRDGEEHTRDDFIIKKWERIG